MSFGTVGTYVIKLIPGIDFTNILRKAFTHEDHKSAKRVTTDCIFALLGSAHVKAFRKMSVKLNPARTRTHSIV